MNNNFNTNPRGEVADLDHPAAEGLEPVELQDLEDQTASPGMQVENVFSGSYADQIDATQETEATEEDMLIQEFIANALKDAGFTSEDLRNPQRRQQMKDAITAALRVLEQDSEVTTITAAPGSSMPPVDPPSAAILGNQVN